MVFLFVFLFFSPWNANREAAIPCRASSRANSIFPNWVIVIAVFILEDVTHLCPFASNSVDGSWISSFLSVAIAKSRLFVAQTVDRHVISDCFAMKSQSRSPLRYSPLQTHLETPICGRRRQG